MTKDKGVQEADEFEGGLVPSLPVHEEPELPDEPSVADVVKFTTNTEATKEAAAKLAENIGVGDVEAVTALINQAMAARDAEVAALRAELDTVKTASASGGMFDEQASVGGYPWMYWKKPENWPAKGERGWIGIGPGGPTPKGNRDAGSYTLYLRKGLIPVTRYGYIEPPKEPNALHTFLPILRKGGAREFPASQVIAFNWHINPPVPGIIFPQYEAVKSGVINFVCEACGHTLYFLADQQGIAGENYRAHLMKAHQYPFREAAEAVRQSGLTLTSYRPVSASSPAEAPVA